MSVMNLQKKYLTAIPPLDADLLLSTAAGKTREFILIHPEYKLSLWQKARFFYFLYQYKKGMPIAYLTGHKEFFGLNFIVNRHVLIPRPETELLVEEVLKKIKSQSTLIDVGTGSGCIPISILKTATQKNINAIAIDVSRSALTIAKKNALRHDIKIKFLHGNLLEPILNNKFDASTAPLIITANLPYLTNEQAINEPSIKYEPKSALIASENGLALYHKLLKQIKHLNHPFMAFFEFDPRQTVLFTKLIKSFFPEAKIEIKKDLAERDRLAIITFS